MKSISIYKISVFCVFIFLGCAESEVTIFPNPAMSAKIGTQDFVATEVTVTKVPASGVIPEGYTIKGTKDNSYPFISFTIRSVEIGQYPVGSGMPTMPVASYAVSENSIETAVNGLIKIEYVDFRPGGKIKGVFNFSSFLSANPINYGRFTAYFPK